MNEMTEEDVIGVLELCRRIDLDVIVDGGWGVDALLGRQTRRHGDLDIALRFEDLPRIRQALEGLGYGEVPKSGSSEWQFVLGDTAGHEIDVHGFTHDGSSKVCEGVPYVFESLAGKGAIAGRAVRCITAEWVVRYHTAYEPDEDDLARRSCPVRRLWHRTAGHLSPVRVIGPTMAALSVRSAGAVKMAPSHAAAVLWTMARMARATTVGCSSCR